MAAKLVDKYNSRYREHDSCLIKSDKRMAVRVYVESEDVPFWKTIFDRLLVPTSVFPISHDRLENGKMAVLKKLEDVGEKLILCVDSDYDYLLQGDTELSKKINESDFVFQTYSYSTENLRCYQGSLQDIIVKATLSDYDRIDLSALMSTISGIIFPLFVKSFYFEMKRRTNDPECEKCTISEFNETVKLDGNFNPDDIDGILGKLKAKVVVKLSELGDFDGLKSCDDRLKDLGVCPQNTYLFIQGHNLLENVVVPILKSVQTQMKTRKEQEIRKTCSDKGNIENKINQLRNEYENRNIKSLLIHNDNFTNCFLYEKIVADVEAFKNNYTQSHHN